MQYYLCTYRQGSSQSWTATQFLATARDDPSAKHVRHIGDIAADMATKGHIKANLKEDQPVKEKPQHYLALPGLPTILHCLAQRIWDLEFVEMEEFLE